MELSKAQIRQFRQVLKTYYAASGRHGLPWRAPEPDGSFDLYKILVSELMLQQTQVPRVIPKYQEFLTAFPSVQILATSQLGQILRAWSGLGYNRRAKYLHEAAKSIAALGYFPNNVTELVKLPGVGKNTAGAIAVYAFNEPLIFVETNVRTVFIRQFFGGRTAVTDTEIISLLEQTIDRQNPRQFYWALMDYGSFLKRSIGNVNKLSKHYVKQSTFHGSRRQVRGQVLKLLGEKQRTLGELDTLVTDTRLTSVLQELTAEGLIRRAGKTYRL